MDAFEGKGMGRPRPAGDAAEPGRGREAASRMTPARVDALRAWVRAGGPDHPAVLDAVARRILDRGHL